MSESSPSTIELTCPGCQASFRLKPKKGKFPKGPIPCPKCGTAIPLDLSKRQSPPRAAASPAPQGGVILKRKKAKKRDTAASTVKGGSDDQDTLKKQEATEDDRLSAFLRAADQLIDDPKKGLNSTYQGFGIAKNLRQTEENDALKDLASSTDKAFEDERSSTDTSHFRREERTRTIDQDTYYRVQSAQGDTDAERSETPLSGVDILSAKTPANGLDAILPEPFPGDEDQPGPFDMRDILDAERSKLEASDPNEVTHNPLLHGGPIVGALSKPDPALPRPDDSFLPSMVQEGGELGASKTVVQMDDDVSGDAHTVAEDKHAYLPESEPLVSRSDIFTDADASPPDAPQDTYSARSDKEVTAEIKTDALFDALDEPSEPEEHARSKKPLSAMLRKKFGEQKIETIRDSLQEQSRPQTDLGLSSAGELGDKAPPTAFISEGGASEDDLDRMLDEADHKRASGPHQHPTKPSLEVSAELSKRLASLSPPSSLKEEDISTQAPSVGEDFKRRLAAHRSSDLDEGRPPVSVKGSSLLARLKPAKVRADQTGEFLAKEPAPHPSQQPADLPDAASIFADDAPSANMAQHIDASAPVKKTKRLTPVDAQSSDAPQGISWASAESIGITTIDDAPSVVRKRHRQESHSGLFPISGGLGQEDSVGLASERKGSGYIRLPTSEIIDVLGKGQYRLLVEDIVYEPVDERGLTELVKRGVILGAEKIAEPGGEWRPINEHPVFRRLKKKMAIEAHALLAKYRRDAQESSAAEEDAAPNVNTMAPPEQEKPATTETSVIELLEEDSTVEEISPPELPTPEAPPIPEALIEQSSREVVALSPEEEVFEEGIREAMSEVQDEGDEHDAQPEVLSFAGTHPTPQGGEEEAFDLDHEHDPLSPPPSSTKRPWVLAGGLLIVGAAISIGALATQPDLRARLFDTSGSIGGDEPADRTLAKGATPHATGAALPALSTRAEVLKRARALANSGRYAEANTLYKAAWSPTSTTSQEVNAYAESLSKAGDQAGIRALAMKGMSHEGGGELRALYEKLGAQALASDPSMRSFEPTVITKDSHGERMELVQSERGLVFKIVDGQGVSWAFHPAQRRRYEDGQWQRDVVAWRLCQLIACTIDIPEALPARIHAATFDHLMTRNGDGAAAPSERFSTLSWTRGEGGAKIVKGALKRWIEPGAYWPFTYTNTWRPWVAAYEPTTNLDVSLDKALASIAREDKPMYDALMAQSDGLDVKALGEQLSGAIAFDYLTNNMNRFKERVAYNGARDNQIIEGRFTSLDHSTTFATRLSSRVKGRFAWVQRFDGALIESIRALDPEESGEILFPKGSGISRNAQRAFWKRRDKFLAAVDALIARYGKENVLVF